MMPKERDSRGHTALAISTDATSHGITQVQKPTDIFPSLHATSTSSSCGYRKSVTEILYRNTLRHAGVRGIQVLKHAKSPSAGSPYRKHIM